MKKIIAFSLILVMIMFAFASCNNEADAAEGDGTTYTVKVTIKDNKNNILYGPEEVTLSQEDGNVPTVFDAVCQVLDLNEAKYETGTFAGNSIIKSIDGIAETSDEFWQFLLDGEEVEARYGACQLIDKSSIDFYYGINSDVSQTAATTEPQTDAKTVNDGYES